MTESKELHVNFKDYFIPKEWLNTPSSQVLFTAYRIINYGGFLPSENHSIFDFEGIRVGLFFGELSYPIMEENWDFTGKNRDIKLLLNQRDRNKEGAWIFFIQPFDSTREQEIKQILSSYIGLYISVFGHSIAYLQEFQHIYHATGSTTFSGNLFLNPNTLVAPNLEDERFDFMKIFDEKIFSLGGDVHRRIKLSLHWFEKGVRTSGVDSFLNYWISLEALAMPNSTDIKPIKEILKNLYHPEENDREDRFFVGKIFGLRSNIVHNGLNCQIPYQVLDYLHSLYVDIIFYIASMPTENRVKAKIASSKLKLEIFFNSLE